MTQHGKTKQNGIIIVIHFSDINRDSPDFAYGPHLFFIYNNAMLIRADAINPPIIVRDEI